MGTILGMDTLSVGDRVRFFVVCAGLAALGVLGVLFAAGRVDRQLELNSQRPGLAYCARPGNLFKGRSASL